MFEDTKVIMAIAACWTGVSWGFHAVFDACSLNPNSNMVGGHFGLQSWEMLSRHDSLYSADRSMQASPESWAIAVDAHLGPHGAPAAV